ncbi:MAG: DUF6636 domain-containing protein [Cyanophyceae cyanobacterium]
MVRQFNGVTDVAGNAASHVARYGACLGAIALAITANAAGANPPVSLAQAGFRNLSLNAGLNASGLNTVRLTAPHFTTPDGKIQCLATDSQLRCELDTARRSIRPLPRRPNDCAFRWGNGLTLGASTDAEVLCAEDSILRPAWRSAKLDFNRPWSHGPLFCRVRPAGLTCVNPDDKGFFLNTQRWRTIPPTP